MAEIEIRSTQHFWSVLVSLEPVKEEVFSMLLGQHDALFRRGFDFYKQRAANVDSDLESLRSISVSSTVIDFVDEASRLLNLDFMQTYEMFSSFLVYDYTGERRDMDDLLMESECRRSFLCDLTCFYNRQLSYLAKCLVEVVRCIVSDQSPYHSVLERYAVRYVGEESFIDGMIREYERVVQFSPPDDLLNGIYVEHHLILQCELVNLIIWVYHIFSVNSDQVLLTAQMLRGAWKLSNRFDKEANIRERICAVNALENFLMVKLCDIELLSLNFNAGDQDDEQSCSLFEHWFEKEFSSKFQAVVNSLCPCSKHSCVHMLWALNRELCRLIGDREQWSCGDVPRSRADYQHFSVIAHKHDSLHSCVIMLDSMESCMELETLDLCRATLYLVLNQCLDLFIPTSLGAVDTLEQLVERLLRCDSVVEQIWATNFSTGISEFVRDTLYLFPYRFWPTIAFLISISTASAHNASKAFNLFRRLPSCSEAIATVNLDHVAAIQADGEQTLYELKQVHYLNGESGIRLPPGTMGTVGNSDYIQWKLFYNGWQFLLADLNWQLNRTPSELLLRRVAVFRLVRQLVKLGPDVILQLGHFFDWALGWTADCCKMQPTRGDVLLLSEIIGCFADASATFPTQVLQRLVDHNILCPSFATADADDIRSACDRILGEGVVNKEYCEFTLGYVQLCCNVIDSESSTHQRTVYHLICTIVQVIFPLYGHWSALQSAKSREIVCLCLSVLEKCLAPASGDALWQRFRFDCLHWLLEVSRVREALLDLVSIGEPAFSRLCQRLATKTAVSSAVRVLCSALRVCTAVADSELSTDQRQVGTRFWRALFFCSSRGPATLLTVGQLLFTRFGGTIPVLAITLLREAAWKFPLALVSTFGAFAGAFGDAFVLRLLCATELAQMRLQCWRFLATALETQYAVVEELVGVESDQQQALAGALVEALGAPAATEMSRAAMSVVKALWRQDCTAMMNCLKSVDHFWEAFCKPLTVAEQQFAPVVVADAFVVLCCEIGATVEPAKPLPAAVRRIVQTLLESDRIELTTKALNRLCLSEADFYAKLESLAAFRDFIQVTLNLTHLSNLWTLASCAHVLQAGTELVLRLMEKPQRTGVQELKLVKIMAECLLLILRRRTSSGQFSVTILSKCLLQLFTVIGELDSSTVMSIGGSLAPVAIALLDHFELVVAEVGLSSEQELMVNVTVNFLKAFQSLWSVAKPKTDHVLLLFSCILLRLLDRLPAYVNRCGSDFLTSYVEYVERIRPAASIQLIQATLNFFSKLLHISSEETLAMLSTSGFERLVYLEPAVERDVELGVGPFDREIQFKCALQFYTSAISSCPRSKHCNSVTASAVEFFRARLKVFESICSSSQLEVFESKCRTLRLVLQYFLAMAMQRKRWPVRIRTVCSDSLRRGTCSVTITLLYYLCRNDALTRLVSSGHSASSQSETSQARRVLTELLFYALQILLQFSPPVDQLARLGLRSNIDSHAFEPLLAIDFGSTVAPQLGDHCRLSFGLLLSGAEQFASALRSKSRQPAGEVDLSPLLLETMEALLALVTSQACLYCSLPTISKYQADQVRDEVYHELNHVVQLCGIDQSSTSPFLHYLQTVVAVLNKTPILLSGISIPRGVFIVRSIIVACQSTESSLSVVELISKDI
ncbi:Nucleoporin -like protein [Trichinella papuae]|uniref:Nucleoporin-like protein n=1 Tax=Trichinella papuae TaxID=268474 RepID=A0A0V1MXQ8_9BILA|nr:Nucleoporin -like protein [Trichinella papuae]